MTVLNLINTLLRIMRLTSAMCLLSKMLAVHLVSTIFKEQNKPSLMYSLFPTTSKIL